MEGLKGEIGDREDAVFIPVTVTLMEAALVALIDIVRMGII